MNQMMNESDIDMSQSNKKSRIETEKVKVENRRDRQNIMLGASKENKMQLSTH